ncbi:MAG: TonB-dependent receptor, partial [Cyclobacteriaceae bacterium]|nr:TonB-dependent receptor [Cyclobacteriaceae bacterium]
GTSSDLEGYFTLEQVKIGRVSLKVNYVGYEEKIIPNLVVNSGKEVILTIEILESVVRLEEITITAGEDSKNEALNEMTLTSARTFTVEETKRFAGTLNDPARMAANYAGAVSSPSGNNDIIVRGNSPKGILWRLEGIEIPNPNHFAGEGATGGPINALNSSMLANSDFLTGAFSPEYGNALSGIFDMKLRQGNSEKREYDISIGVIGIDMTLEGPFAKGKRASYLLNARYSSLEILDRAGLVDFGGVPRYKDLSFKFHFPTKKLGAFSLFGLGGKSDISLDSVTNRQRDFSEIRVLSNSGANLGVVGLNHVYFLNENFYVSSFASVATNGMESLFQNINNTSVEYGSYDLQTKQAIRTGTSLNKKLNARNKIQAGFIYSYQDFSFDQQYEINDTLYTALDEKNEAGLLQAYISWKHRFNNKVTLVNGIHNTLFSLNNSFAIEPRTSLEWKIKENQTFNMGAGLHSKPQTLPAYFVSINNESGVAETPNKDLKLTKAAHFVTGYSIMFGPVTHLKIEAYYQHLFHVPVEADPRGNESLINSIDFYDLTAFVSKGTGQNYGLELTLEKFLSHHFYYLFTSSLYESKYQALDGITRNTRWNANYASNFLIGKEFVFAAKKNKERVIGLNAKVSLLGGNRFNPINLEQSRAQTAMIRYDDPPYTKKGDDIFLLNAGVSYKVNRKNATHEIKLEVLNATNHASKVDEYYAPWTQEIVEIKQWPLLPNIIYRVQF